MTTDGQPGDPLAALGDSVALGYGDGIAGAIRGAFKEGNAGEPRVLITGYGTADCVAPANARLRLTFYGLDDRPLGTEELAPGEARDIAVPEGAHKCVPVLILPASAPHVHYLD